MAGRPVRISIIANGRQARAELQRTALAGERLGRSVSRAGKLVAGAFAVSTIARVGRAVLANGDAYVSQLNKIEALTTAQQRAQVGGMSGVAKQLESAKGLYARYGNSVADAAGGVTELVKAGQSLPQALKSINATLVLAKAGEMDVAEASSLVATALMTWHMPAKRAGDVANYLANAANISTADVTDLSYALKFVAPVAAKVGVTAAQTAAYLAQLSNAGINGTLAGTGLRKVMQSLQAPTGKARDTLDELGVSVFDAQGKVRPLSKVLTEMRDKFRALSDEERLMDMRRIFGLTGVTSATVLLDNVDKIDSYTAAVKRAGAAQALAAANSKGLMGTLRRARALFQSVGQQAFRAFSPVVDNALRPMVERLERNQTSLEAQGRTLGARVVPYLKTFANTVDDAAHSVRDMAGDLKPFVPVLTDTAKAVKVAAEGFNAVPGPVKTLALEAGLASLVLPRLAGGVSSVTTAVGFNIARLKQWRAEMTYTETRAQNAAALTTRLGAAAKSAAGIGGLLALTKSASETNTGLAALERIGGGAALGFSVAGPWGAAIGGTVGLLATLRGAFGQTAVEAQAAARQAAARESWASAKQAVQELTTALHGTVKAYNDVTAAAVQKGFRDAEGHIKPWVQSLLDAGVSMDTLTRATLGQRDAQALLSKAQGQLDVNLLARKGTIDQAKQALDSYSAAVTRSNAEKGIAPQPDQLLKIQALKGAVADATRQYEDYKSSLNEGRRELQAYGNAVTNQASLERSLAQSLGLSKRAYDAMPRSVRTKLETVGAPQSRTAVLDFIKTAKLTPKQIVSVLKATGVTVSKKEAESLGLAYDKVPRDITSRARVVGGAAAKGAAGRFGKDAGDAYGAGFTGGIAAWTGRAEFAAAAMAGAAHAAAMRRLDAHSPSKEMVKLGKWFSQGFAIGIRTDSAKVLDAVDKLYDRLDQAQNRILAHTPKSRRKALQQQFRDQDRSIRKLVRSYVQGKHGLNAIARAQSAVSDKIDDARSKLADAKQAWVDYRDALKASVVAFGDITQLGKNDAGNATADGIVKALTIRRDAVEKYVSDIERLKKAGLNGTALQQILDAGVDGGLQTAEAILAGGSGALQTINQLQGQIDQAAGALGTSMANNFKSAGVAAAQGLLDGLLKEQQRLNKVAEALADSLVAAIKKKLKIKSPSRVFRQIGRYNVEGLRLGMASGNYVKRTGQMTAASLLGGFGQPQLSAGYMTAPGMRAPAFQLHLTADKLDALQRGQRVIADVAHASSVGGARTIL